MVNGSCFKAAALVEIAMDDQCSEPLHRSRRAKASDLACVSDPTSVQSVTWFYKVNTASAIIMRGPGSRPSLLFKLVVPATAIFAITVLALIAVIFSDPRAPLAQFLDRHGNTLLLAEFVVVIVLSLLAMTVDRIQTLRGRNRGSEQSQTSGETDMNQTDF